MSSLVSFTTPSHAPLLRPPSRIPIYHMILMLWKQMYGIILYRQSNSILINLGLFYYTSSSTPPQAPAQDSWLSYSLIGGKSNPRNIQITGTLNIEYIQNHVGVFTTPHQTPFLRLPSTRKTNMTSSPFKAPLLRTPLKIPSVSMHWIEFILVQFLLLLHLYLSTIKYTFWGTLPKAFVLDY